MRLVQQAAVWWLKNSLMEEASFIVMVDGENVLPMATSQDHKRVGDADTGPNTAWYGCLLTSASGDTGRP